MTEAPPSGPEVAEQVELSPVQRHVEEALWIGMREPWWTRSLVGLLVAIHLLGGIRMWQAGRIQFLGIVLSARDLTVLDEMGAMRGLRVSAGEYWRLVSCIFLHGDGAHILLNGVALLALGRLCEAVYGPTRFLVLFLFAGICGSLLSWAGGNANSVGASGGIFGLMGAAIVFGYRFKEELPPHAGEMFRKGLLPWVGLNLFIGAVIPFIDNLGHTGGLIGGSLLALVLGNRVIPGAQGSVATTATLGILVGLGMMVGLLGVLGILR